MERRLRDLVLALTWSTVLVGCNGKESSGPGLADACVSNDDCERDFVCAFGRCHQQCDTSSACPEGARCVLSRTGESVCQLPDDERCTADSDCLAPLICGADGTCRNECQQDSDCPTAQSCSNDGACADADEIDAAGSLVTKPPPTPISGTSGSAGANAAGGSASTVGGTGGTTADGGRVSGGGGGSAESGGAQATGGAGNVSGGTGGIVGTGGTEPSGRPVVAGITVSNGYATGYGLQGYWYSWIYGEASAVPECPDPCFSQGGAALCFSGTREGGQVGVIWNLNQSRDADPTEAGDSADLSAYTTMTLEIRDNMAAMGTVYVTLSTGTESGCMMLASGSNVLPLLDFVDECWAPPDVPDVMTLEELRSIRTLAISTWPGDTPVDYCLAHLSFE